MYHTFNSRHEAEQAAAQNQPQAPMRKLNKSCSECTRRKVKCDGAFPCGSCWYYKIPDACVYKQRSKRQAASRTAYEQAVERVEAQGRILHLLFPGTAIAELTAKKRPELLALLAQQPSPDEGMVLAAPNDPPSGMQPEPESPRLPDDSTAVSENGEEEHERRWDELAPKPAPLGASDDINAISLATDKHRRSYLGVTSMSAVLRALFRLCPSAKQHIVEQAKSWNGGPGSFPQPSMPLAFINAAVPNPLREQRCVDFYFENIHGITPLFNEDDFRATYAAGSREDGSWMALLNMVLTLGSIASGSDTLHLHYYKQARVYLDLDSLGSGNLESLQALCLLGGYYLHYKNSPNMAYAVLGAAQRVAIALGLHRESLPRRNEHQSPESAQKQASHSELRRRTWWSLFCLDTWASMTLGRPTCGRWDSSTMDTHLPSLLAPDDHFAASLRASSQFCLICNRIQHRFAQSARISITEAQALDQELQDWHDGLPEPLRSSTSAQPRMVVAREFLRNRYLNARLILSRCFLLYAAHDDTKGSSAPAEEDIVAICRTVACEAIDAITLHWTPNRVHVWNSAWYLFQACMVPLLAIALETARQQPGASSESIAACWVSLNKALELFSEMKPWMRETDRGADIVAALFHAVTEKVDGSTIRTPSVGDGGLDLFGWYDEQLTELDWNSLVNDDSIAPQNMFSYS
ncbi:fungal-specific transcription factor domain-containing protein [Plectosphaerella cucumerina]|uniref:Fungal-specific transcription factor domain-containing protein n=1 Tax=Plectosphaerella cucumerina TaxID=40658 RepID=A0A8K0TFC9_9PEZI|nr:fungal-specific transcription factor domain-containing protein [Plectosphaerella cucumerina]